MLILVAVTVRTVVQSGLFEHASSATKQWAAEQEKEGNIGNGPITINGKEYDSIEDYIKETTGGGTIPTEQTITITADAYTGEYDGTAHPAVTNVTTNPDDATVTYSLDGVTYTSTIPTVTEVGTYTVKIKAEKEGYETKTVDKTASVTPMMTTDRSILNIGDYIAYTPDAAENYMGLGTSESEKAGTTSNSAEGIPQDTTLTWRVMNINDDGSVDIVSTKSTKTGIWFKHALGVNNGVLLLNDLCKTLYSNSTLGVTARSINLVDIEKNMSSKGISARNNYFQDGGTQKYGDLSSGSCKLPLIFTKKNETAEEASKDYYSEPTTETYSKDYANVILTGYSLDFSDSTYFENEDFSQVLIDTNNGFWIATRYSGLMHEGRNLMFGIYQLFPDGSLKDTLPLSYQYGDCAQYFGYVRPVVQLGSNIKLSISGGTAENPRMLSK